MSGIADKVIELANKHLGEYKIRNGQVVAKICPFCKGGDSGDTETFAVGLYNGAYNCARGHCGGMDGNGGGREGDFRRLSEYFGESGFEFSRIPRVYNEPKKTYVKPDPETIKPITEQIVTYFATRMISEQTLKDWKIGSDDKGNIVFPFYKDGILTYVKYRKPKKHEKADGPKEWQMADTEPILFGMDNVSYNRPLIICEGEIDALSLYEAGATNVVSVPSGCNNMEWVSLCYDWLENFQQIILFGDSDEPGQTMVTALMDRLGEDRCLLPGEYPEVVWNGKHLGSQCKDANAILCCYGPEGLKEIVDRCEPAPIKGLIDVASIPFNEPNAEPRIMTKIPGLDMMLEGLGQGGITVISGRRGEGKSTISNNLLLAAIQQGYKCCAYSGELSKKKFMNWLTLTATESKYIEYYTSPQSGKNLCCISRQIYERICQWLSGKFYLFDNKEVFDTDQETAVLKSFEIAARRYGCKLFLVDNLMSLLTTGDEENRAQGKFMAQLKAFATKYNVHVLCIAHPRKEKADQVFTSDSVSGSSVITNIADNVLAIEKPNIRVTKNRDYGETGLVQCEFNPTNRRIYQKKLGDKTVYGWDHTDIPLPANPACSLPEFQIQEKKESVNPF